MASVFLRRQTMSEDMKSTLRAASCPPFAKSAKGWATRRRCGLAPPRVFLQPTPHGVTVKVPELVTVPPVVVMAIFPVIAPVGTVAVT